MEWFFYVLGILWLAAGVCYILFAETTRIIVTKIMENAPHRVLAVLAAVIGLLLFIGAPRSGCPPFFMALGGIGLLKGILFWFNPGSIYKKIMRWYLHDTSDFFFNAAGIFMVILGTAVILLA